MVVSETGTLGRNVKVSLLKMVLISADPLSVVVITVFTGTSVAASLGMTSRGPVGGATSLIVRENDLVAVPPPVTWTVKVEVPVAVGVPLRTPDVDRVSPAGSDPDEVDHVNGAVPPVAANVWL